MGIDGVMDKLTELINLVKDSPQACINISIGNNSTNIVISSHGASIYQLTGPDTDIVAERLISDIKALEGT